MAFQRVEVGVWKPENAGDSIQGFFTKMEQGVGANNSNVYTLEVDKKPTTVWGSTLLDPNMSVAKKGDLVKIVYTGLGEAKQGHNAPKKFDVFIDREPTDDSETKIVSANEELDKAQTESINQ